MQDLYQCYEAGRFNIYGMWIITNNTQLLTQQID